MSKLLFGDKNYRRIRFLFQNFTTLQLAMNLKLVHPKVAIYFKEFNSDLVVSHRYKADQGKRLLYNLWYIFSFQTLPELKEQYNFSKLFNYYYRLDQGENPSKERQLKCKLYKVFFLYSSLVNGPRDYKAVSSYLFCLFIEP